MTVFTCILLGFLVVCAIAASLSKNLLNTILIFMSYSLVMSIIWILLESPDLAITEAAVGAGVTTVLFLVTLKKIDAIIKKDDQTRKDNDVEKENSAEKANDTEKENSAEKANNAEKENSAGKANNAEKENSAGKNNNTEIENSVGKNDAKEAAIL